MKFDNLAFYAYDILDQSEFCIWRVIYMLLKTDCKEPNMSTEGTTYYETREELLQAIEQLLQSEAQNAAEQFDEACVSCLRRVSFAMPQIELSPEQALQKARLILANKPEVDYQVVLHIGDRLWRFHRSSHDSGSGWIQTSVGKLHSH